MLNVFKKLIKKQKPTHIITMRVVNYEQLSAVTCQYGKDGEFYTAVSFFTDAWISKYPNGPVSSDLIMSCTSLQDIATVYRHDSKDLALSFKSLTASDLEAFVYSLKVKLLHGFEEELRIECSDDVVETRLLFVPVLSVIVVVSDNTGLVGSICVSAEGSVSSVFRCSPRLDTYIHRIKQLISAAQSKCVSQISLSSGGSSCE